MFDVMVKYMAIMRYHLIKLLFGDQLHLPVTKVFPITSTSFLSCVFLMLLYRFNLRMNLKINPYKVNVQNSSSVTCHLLCMQKWQVTLWKTKIEFVHFMVSWFVLILSGPQIRCPVAHEPQSRRMVASCCFLGVTRSPDAGTPRWQPHVYSFLNSAVSLQ